MGLDVYLLPRRIHDLPWEHPDRQKDRDIKSDKYPDHLCNKRYLRSSYNEGGFNSKVHNLIGWDLYKVFGIDYNAIEQTPGWVDYDDEKDTGGYWCPTLDQLTEALARAQECETLLGMVDEGYGVSTVMITSDPKEITCTEDALSLFKKRKAEWTEQEDKRFGGSYSCAEGSFFLDEGMEVAGVIPGYTVLGMPAVYLVYKLTDEDIGWYKQMSEIVVEFCKEAIRLKIAGEEPVIVWSA